MKNIKKILSAITALGLITTAAVSVNACANNNILNLPLGVTKVLGLTDANGTPLITPSLKLDVTNNQYSWTSALKPITGKSFVDSNFKSLNEDCSSLLKTTFQLIPNPDGSYNGKALDEITANISFLPKINKNIDGNDFYISGGVIQIQFVKNNKNINNLYNVDLRPALNNTTLINSEFSSHSILMNDFDTSGSATSNPLFNGPNGFKVGQDVKDLKNKECYLLIPDDAKATDNDKIIASLNKILATKIMIKISAQSKDTGKWVDDDTITVDYYFTYSDNTVKILQTTDLHPNSLNC